MAYDDDDQYNVGVANSTATTNGLIPRGTNQPPFPVDLSASPAVDWLGALAQSPDGPPPLSASPTAPPARALAQNPAPPPPLSASPSPTPAPPPAPAMTPDSVYGDYSPDKRAALVQAMIARRTSPGSTVGGALSGLGDAIARSYGHADTHFADTAAAQNQEADKRSLDNFDTMQKQSVEKAQMGMSLARTDPNSAASKAAQTAARPMLAAAGLDDKAIAQLPADAIDQALKSATSFADAKAKLAQVAAMREATRSTREDGEQDRLENQAMQRISSVRGDQSLKDAESKRDAAITVYNTIENLKKEGRAPSKLEYYDLLGQMWKARTGASPTDQAIRDLDTKTFKGDLNQAVSYFSGKPAAATTGGVLQNIQDFAKESGKQADAFHESYMKPHLIKPASLDQSRWDAIASAGRGRSFVDATKATDAGGQNLVPRQTKDGRTALFDPNTRAFVKWADQ